MSKIAISKEGKITYVSVDNKPINLLTIDLINELNKFILSLKDDRDTTVVVFKSLNPVFFLAHLDITLINGTPGGQAACIEFSHLIHNIKSMQQLSVCIVDGYARGGGDEFVMACDLSYGTENAAFAQPELYINIPTGGQGAVQYARRLGKSKALQALLTGADFSPQQAETLNIITRHVPKAEMEGFLSQLLGILSKWELEDIGMYKNIVAISIKDEQAGAELELRYFLSRAKDEKTQTIITTFLKHGGQTEREAEDMQGIFFDTVKELEG